jgi:hypothetical protein
LSKCCVFSNRISRKAAWIVAWIKKMRNFFVLIPVIFIFMIFACECVRIFSSSSKFKLIYCLLSPEQYITKLSTKKFECESDGVIVVNPICRLRATLRNLQTTTVSMNITKPISNAWVTSYAYMLLPISKCFMNLWLFQVRVINNKKTSSNRYMPGLYDIVGNYCEIFNESSQSMKFILNTVRTLNPAVYQQLRENTKPCPLMVTNSVI